MTCPTKQLCGNLGKYLLDALGIISKSFNYSSRERSK